MRSSSAASSGVVAALLVLPLLQSTAEGQQLRQTPWQYQQREAQDALKGMTWVQWAGWGPVNEKVMRVVAKLVDHSHEVFRVVPAQNFDWGFAHEGGWILFDISSAMKLEPIMAFRLAHEWGHEALGHQANIYNSGSAWMFKRLPKLAEDQADDYAGTFLAKYGYPLDPVVFELRSLPPSPPSDAHSDGPQRAAIVSLAYNTFVKRSASNNGQATPGGRGAAPQCVPNCRQVFDTCDAQAAARGRGCILSIQSSGPYTWCGCPNWSTGNFACRDVCSAAYEQAKQCGVQQSIEQNTCESGFDDCKAACP